jgi:hypothetical protein
MPSIPVAYRRVTNMRETPEERKQRQAEEDAWAYCGRHARGDKEIEDKIDQMYRLDEERRSGKVVRNVSIRQRI